jgi:hypothetical protein
MRKATLTMTSPLGTSLERNVIEGRLCVPPSTEMTDENVSVFDTTAPSVQCGMACVKASKQQRARARVPSEMMQHNRKCRQQNDKFRCTRM